LTPGDERIVAVIFELLDKRGANATLCPSEAARALSADASAWRASMPEIRRVAASLAAAGRLRVTAHGEDVDPLAARGPIRLGRPLNRD
jgi:hypothetical protein